VTGLDWQPFRKGLVARVAVGSQVWFFVVSHTRGGRWKAKVVLRNRSVVRSTFRDKRNAMNDCELRYAVLLADYNRERIT
jgi:hypothetical protein